MKLFNKKNRRIDYISKNIKFEDINNREKRDLVLAPNFYWVKRENLGVPSEKEAIKFAKSVFDGVLPELDSFKFFTIKEKVNEKAEISYLFIAYNPIEISKYLVEIGIDEKNIANIYIAQSEFNEIVDSIIINDNKSIVSIDGIISEIPFKTESQISIINYLQSNKRSKYSIKIKGLDSEGSPILLLSAIPFAISIYFGLDIYKLNSDKVILENEIIKRREAYKLPDTSFQIASLLKKFETIEEDQSNLRDNLYWLSESNFNSFGKIQNLVIYKNGELNFKFKIKQKDKLNEMKMTLQKKNKKVSISENGDIIDVSFPK